MRKKTTGSILQTITILFVLALAVFMAIYETIPSKVLPINAPATEFSAERAMRHVEIIASEPRPAGSAGNARARAYIVEQLNLMGLEPIIQSATACGHYPKIWCASPNNVIAKIEGTDSADAILLVAHYDSQQDCPCASDDAHGVAVILETARGILSGPQLKNTVILLFSDAHEWNFHGAAAFVTQHPWMQQVRLVFAYDAAFSGGPASMGVYDQKSAWIIGELKHTGEYPFTNSIFRSFIDHPGGDLNAFLDHGYSGIESGFWSSVYYHSSLDNIDNFKPASLQHQGTVALAMVRHFGNLELVDKQEPFPIYFNLLRHWLVVYPASWVIPITALIVSGYVVMLMLGLKRKRLTWLGMGSSALVFLFSLAMSVLVVRLLYGAIRFLNPLYRTEHTANFEGLVYNQAWLAVVFASLIVALTSICFILLQSFKKVNIVDLTVGTQAVLLVGLLVLTLVAPGASYLLAWPLLFSLIAPAYWIITKNDAGKPLSIPPLLGLLVAGVVTILLQVPIILAAFSQTPAQAYIPTTLLVVTLGFLSPHLYLITERRRWWLPSLAGLVVLVVIIPLLADNFDAQKPRYFDLCYVLDADQGKALWATSDDTNEEVLSSLFPQGKEKKKLPWLEVKSPFYVYEAPLADLYAPAVDVIEDAVTGEIRTIHLRFSSRRGATILYATVTNPDLVIHSVTVNGIASATPLNRNQADQEKITLPDGVANSDLWMNRTLFYFEGLEVGAEINVVAELSASAPFDLTIIDSSFGLPAFSESLLSSLPAGALMDHTETTVYTKASLGNGK
ncbi:MAG TPA: M28 family peptidase [Anaerolineales bacterium]|nr:M28 family peptidase [Anaerolineales bacterium]